MPKKFLSKTELEKLIEDKSTIGPQVLYYEGTHSSLSAVYWRYLWALKYYRMGASIGPQLLYIGSTHRFSGTIY